MTIKEILEQCEKKESVPQRMFAVLKDTIQCLATHAPLADFSKQSRSSLDFSFNLQPCFFAQ